MFKRLGDTPLNVKNNTSLAVSLKVSKFPADVIAVEIFVFL